MNMVRMAVCTIIHDFDIEAMDTELELMKTGFVTSDKNNIHLKITKRNCNEK